MGRLTRREFLKTSSAAVGFMGMGSTADLWGMTEVATENSGARATFYVATNGDDRWSGKLESANAGRTDGPFATLGRARDAVRQLKAGKAPKSAIVVVVRGAKYFLDKTVVFGPEDSGSREFPVIYKAYAGEKPILSGGKKVSGWKPYKGQILQTQLAGAKGGEWKFRQLFLNGEPLIRSRYPKYDKSNPLYGGWLFMQGPVEKNDTASFIYKSGSFPRAWVKAGNGEVFVFPTGGWTNNIIPIESVDPDKRIINLARPMQDPDRTPWWSHTPVLAGDRFRVENLLEDLTEPGEWCLDSEDGIVYLWPPSVTLKTTDEVVAPVLDTLIDIHGASWLGMSEFTFTETTGGDDVQRDSLDGYGPMYPNQGWKYCGEALHMREAEHCVIEKNRFYAVGGNAIYLERYNARNVIRGNEISHAGANGICLLGNHIKYPVPPYVPENAVANLVGAPSSPWIMNKQPLPMFNEITDNHIHHCGVLNKYIAGVFLGVSDENTIAHNQMEDLPHHAVCLGQNGFGRNVIEYNAIHHVCLETADNGAINCWMDNESSDERDGHVIRFNLITDVQGCSTDPQGRITTPNEWANGIYLDNYSSNCFVYGNIIVRPHGFGIFVQSGRNNFIENNIISDPGAAAVAYTYGFNPMPGYATGHRFARNIVHWSKVGRDLGRFYIYSWNDEIIAESERNLFSHPDPKGLQIVQITLPHPWEAVEGIAPQPWKTRNIALDEWQKMGYDTSSEVADPKFVDVAKGDYRLQPDSPAIRLGFVPIDMSHIGRRHQA